jgi:hypothetical protein
MEIPFELIMALFSLTFVLAIIGVWKKIPLAMFVGGALITFTFILTDSITALGDTQTCTTEIATTTCTFEPYVLDVWIKILFMLLGSVFMIAGALIWKAIED